jgi:hypothetical protein
VSQSAAVLAVPDTVAKAAAQRLYKRVRGWAGPSGRTRAMRRLSHGSGRMRLPSAPRPRGVKPPARPRARARARARAFALARTHVPRRACPQGPPSGGPSSRGPNRGGQTRRSNRGGQTRRSNRSGQAAGAHPPKRLSLGPTPNRGGQAWRSDSPGHRGGQRPATAAAAKAAVEGSGPPPAGGRRLDRAGPCAAHGGRAWRPVAMFDHFDPWPKMAARDPG